jgi:hypothetical protein
MYKYKIGYGTYEESDYSELTHEEHYDKYEISRLIAECIAKLIDKGTHVHDYEGIHSEIIDMLIDEYGFEEIQYDTIWDVFGWGSLFESRNFNNLEDLELDTIKFLLKEMGYTIWNDTHHGSDCWTSSVLYDLAEDHYTKWNYPLLYQALKAKKVADLLRD